MYHYVDIDPDSANALMALTSLAYRTLDFGLRYDPTNLPVLQGPVIDQVSLMERLDQDDSQFLAQVREAYINSFRSNKQAAAAWLWERNVLAADLVRLVMLPIAQKTAFRPALKQEMRLRSLFTTDSVAQFLYRGAAEQYPATHKLIYDIMLYFYEDIFGRGIEYKYLGQPGIRKFTRQVFLNDFRQNNRDTVCSGCDSGKLEATQTTKGRSRTNHVYADIDHLLPKSLYPLLAVHPLNLTPYCKRCNQDFKRDNDALRGAPALGLNGIYHPHLRPARGEVAVTVEQSEAGTERIRLHPAAVDTVGLARLDSLRHIFNLEGRWQDKLEEQTPQNNLKSQLHLILLAQGEHEPQDDWLGITLPKIMPGLERRVGHQDWGESTVAYARYLANNPHLHPMFVGSIKDLWQQAAQPTQVKRGRYPRTGIQAHAS